MRTVPTKYPTEEPKLRIAFVGEAPSVDELVKGEPFVGPSGRVFNAGLRSANLDRNEFLITNVFDVKAPDNDCTEWIKDKEFHEPHLERLNRELTEWQPNVIVPLGGTALWAFTGYSEISQFRGSVTKATRICQGSKLVPSYHPAAVQRQWKYFPVMTGDFIKAANEALKGPSIIYPKVRILTSPTASEAIDYLKGPCMASDLLSMDIETGWGQITFFGIAPTDNEAMAIPFVDLRKANKSYWKTVEEEVAVMMALKGVIESPIPKLFQNGPYDAYWITEFWGFGLRNYCEDTRLMHHAMYPELPKGLADMAGYTDLGAWKHFGRHEDKDDN